MENKLISVIMSTYNTNEEYLKFAIESILNQTYELFEFIIVCDGSTRDLEIINKYKDKRIKIIKHEQKKGLPKSLNEAIEISKGKYIARMDSDDIALENRLKLQIEFMEKHKEIDICSTFYKTFGKEDKTIVNAFTKSDDIKCELLFRSPILHPGVMIRTKFLIDNNLRYNEDFIYSQDFELWTRCCQLGKIAILPKITMKYRIHDKQIGMEKKQMQHNFARKILLTNLKNIKMNENNLEYLEELHRNEKY